MSVRPDVPLGHTIPAHQAFGWCSYCPDRTPAEELAAWQTREMPRVADETAATETQAHVCKPDAIAYYCPTSGEAESNCHGGFDACCDRPDLHQPAAGARQDGAQPLPTPAETAPADEAPHVYMDAVQDSAAWAYALTKAGQTAEALEHVEAMERLLAVYRRAVGA